jgi:GMP synthase (glutamine-hydrolysing)
LRLASARNVSPAVHIIQHVGFEDVGSFKQTLDKRGYVATVLEAGISDLDTEVTRNADLLVVLGGPIGAYEERTYPFLATERTLIAARLERKLPVLGVCLGAQLLALSANASVYPGPVKEIGWAPVTLSPEGERSPLAAIAGIPVLHWHGDTFDLPHGAVGLASTAAYPNQAFSIGQHALGLQFHIEAGARIEQWLIGHALELATAGVDVAALRSETRANLAASAVAANAVLDAWLDGLPNQILAKAMRSG